MALSLTDVTVQYGDLRAVDDVSLELPAGQVLAVLGPSGCGKSTLLRAVAGLEPVRHGSISFDGRDLADVPTHRRGFALMFQDGQLFAHLTVSRNVAYALRLRRVPAARRADRVLELLDLVGLVGFEDRLPATLSGGERQRVALARALAVEPRLLLLDEPLSALDTALRGRLASDLRHILRVAGTTALLVTHDHEEAFTVADEMAVMRQGRIVQRGGLAEVWRRPVDVDTALFLGYSRVLTGAAAHRVLAAAGLPAADALAVRRSALVATATGPLTGRVAAVRSTPEQLRLVVDLPGLGELDAVAPLDAHLAPGDPVVVRVDPTRVAPLGRDAREDGGVDVGP
ncbi:MAG: ABC transporter ATP-binding protein [Nocardioides sp.]